MVDRLPPLGGKGAYLKQKVQEELIGYKLNICEHGEHYELVVGRSNVMLPPKRLEIGTTAFDHGKSQICLGSFRVCLGDPSGHMVWGPVIAAP